MLNQNLIMKKQLLTTIALCMMLFSFGQNNFKKNDIYLEAGGNGLFGSVNYERQLTKEPGLGVRIGVGFYSENAFYLTVPIGINYLFKLKNEKSFIDVGIGATWTRMNGKFFDDSNDSNDDHFVNFVPSIGYRSHTANNLMWRISVTPVANKYGLVPWIGASIGKRF